MSKPALIPVLSLALALAGCPGSHGSDDTGPTDAGPMGVDGCACIFEDAPGGPDAYLERPDAGPRPTCDAQAAAIDLCAPTCDTITGAFWDGARCVEHSCNCTGTECNVYGNLAACEAAHARCDASLCESTGGAWFARPQFCGHFECGTPPEFACLTPVPACDCGTYGIFVEGTGCMPGPLCELVAPREDEALCGETGGTWELGICGPTTCGRYSDLDCAAPGCVCGAYEIWDDERGCIESPDCDVRELGEDCSATMLCANSVCCFGGAGGARCEAPQCGDPSGLCGPPRP